MEDTFSLDRPDTLTEAVYDRIQQAIVRRELQPGSRVTEAGIAEQLGVSKTPVREALLRLRQIGLIESDGPRTNRVASPSDRELHQAYEMRRVLEVFAAGAAAKHASDDVVDRIARVADRSLVLAAEHDLLRFREPDREFHRLIAEAAGNPRMARAIADVSVLIRTLRQRDQPDAEALVEFGEAHVRIATAIAAGDSEGAQQAMQAHLEQVERTLLPATD